MENIEEKKPEETSATSVINEESTTIGTSLNCDFCHKKVQSIDTFSCSHKICPICLFRRTFILNITELNGSSDNLKINCKLCGDGHIEKDLDKLCDMSSLKADSIKAMKEKENMANSDDSNKCQEHHLFKEILCLDCCEQICKKCKSNQNNSHFKHNTMTNEKVSKMLKELREFKKS